jgi:hypothetical protein
MALIFCDDVSRERQMLYWRVLHEQVSIDEWEYACQQAMRRETFHKVPLPGQLLDYVREYRQQAEEHARREHRYRAEEKRLQEEHARRQLAPDPHWQEEQERCLQEAMEQLNQLWGLNWRTVADMQLAAEHNDRVRRNRDLLAREERDLRRTYDDADDDADDDAE